MRLFVSEYLCSGAWPEPVLPPSLAREGRAMLLALLSDLAALPDITLCTTWDARLGDFPLEAEHPPEPRGLSRWPPSDAQRSPSLPREQRQSLKPRDSGERAGVRGIESLQLGATGSASAIRESASNCHALAKPVAPGVRSPVNATALNCTIVHSAADEQSHFDQLAAECDATYVIAPELDNLLTERVQSVVDVGGRSLNASPAAIAACSDKWETFQLLSAANLPTIQTARFDPDTSALPFEYPLVLKPGFGAGSQNTFLIHNADQLRTAAACFSSEQPTTKAIVQPYVPGRSLSVAAIIRSDGSLRELWPLAEQRLSTDGRFTYLGGCIPVALDPPLTSRISDLIFEISNLIPGLRGYIGFDLIVPDDDPTVPLIIDMNPRLTTSYLGYRAISNVNLAERILWPDRDGPPIVWDKAIATFDSEGMKGPSPRATSAPPLS